MQNPLIKEYLDVALRRKWWVVIPALAGLLCSVALFFWIPKLYKAHTRVKIRDQMISTRVMRPIIEIESTELVTAITSEITSEKYVQELEDELQLIGKPGGPQSLSQLTRFLGAAIDVSPNPRSKYFDLNVTWSDPRIAAAIANEVAAIYIKKNKEMRRDLAQDTLGKISERRREIESQLQEVSARIRQYRSAHAYELESYQGINSEQIKGNNTEIERVDALIRGLQDKLREIDLQRRMPTAAGNPIVAVDPRVEALRVARAERESLILQYTKNHPKVVAVDDRIARLERDLGSSGSTGGGPSDPGGSNDLAASLYQDEINRLNREIKLHEAKRERLVGENNAIRSRLQRTPNVQIELDQLLHRRDQLEAEYDDIRRKELEGTEGFDVEEFGTGERFEVLNSARPPKEPFWPNWQMFLMMGLATGGGLGVGLVLLLEVFDQSFKSEEQLAASIDLPILAVIPDLDKVGDRNSRNRAKKMQKQMNQMRQTG